MDWFFFFGETPSELQVKASQFSSCNSAVVGICFIFYRKSILHFSCKAVLSSWNEMLGISRARNVRERSGWYSSDCHARIHGENRPDFHGTCGNLQKNTWPCIFLWISFSLSFHVVIEEKSESPVENSMFWHFLQCANCLKRNLQVPMNVFVFAISAMHKM